VEHLIILPEIERSDKLPGSGMAHILDQDSGPPAPPGMTSPASRAQSITGYAPKTAKSIDY
jgi:hypothetical protein